MVTLDYPSVSDFDRDFLSLSSRGQWSSMLHRADGIIDPGSKADIRSAYQPSLSSPLLPLSSHVSSRVSFSPASLPGPCHSRITALGPAFRALEYYRARHGAEASIAALSSTSFVLLPFPFSFYLSLTRALSLSLSSSSSCTSSIPRWLPCRSPSARTRDSRVEAPSKPHVRPTSHRTLHLSAISNSLRTPCPRPLSRCLSL